MSLLTPAGTVKPGIKTVRPGVQERLQKCRVLDLARRGHAEVNAEATGGDCGSSIAFDFNLTASFYVFLFSFLLSACSFDILTFMLPP